jgi:hypothetical protein
MRNGGNTDSGTENRGGHRPQSPARPDGDNDQVFAYGGTFAIPLIAFLWTIVILITCAAAKRSPVECLRDGGHNRQLFFPRGRPGRAAVRDPEIGPGLRPDHAHGPVPGQQQPGGSLRLADKDHRGRRSRADGRLEPALSRLAANLKAPLGAQPSSAAFGMALVIANVLLGFLFFYLWARSLLQRDLELSDGFADSDDAAQPAPTPVAQTPITLASEHLSVPEQPLSAVQPPAPEAM